jgi:hypothetical protein
MMKWLDESVLIDASVAAVIARDLRQIAEIDGHLHERELSLIEAFQKEIPEEASNDDIVLEGEKVRHAYLRSLIMLGLADGELADEELELIHQLANRRGIDSEVVDSTTAQIKKEFFSIFSGVSLFRQSLMGIAEGMGLDSEEIWD